MPAWMHQRAEHILTKNPSMPKSEAFAIATQQSHALGKSPKSYGTLEGRETAKAKYDTPKDDKKTANPGNLSSPKMASVVITTPPSAQISGANAPPTPSATHSKPSAAVPPPPVSPGLSIMFAPKPRGQMNAMLAVDRAKTAASLEKRALLERLVRLGATDVPNTPRLFMRERSPEELSALQHGVDAAFEGVQGPLREKATSLIGKSPLPDAAKKMLGAGAHLLINHPETIPMQAVPIPGMTPGYLGVKKGLEKAIDRFSPALPPQHLSTMLPEAPQRSLLKAAAGAPTRGGFMQASDVPPLSVPSLRAPVQKLGDALPDGLTYSPGDFKKAKLSEGAGDGMSMDSQTAAENQAPEDYKKTGSGVDIDRMERGLRERRPDLFKKADVSPSRAWSPGTGGAARQASYVPPITAPSLRSPVTKLAGTGLIGSSAPAQPPPPIPAPTVAKTIGTPKFKAPGPSIADIAKPKGPGFGTGIAGAFKPQTGVGGTGPIDMNTKLGPGNSK